ncbi:MAG: hypothetical protein JNK87_24500 [Bryobacterales bacterium]|nr:hypothetical protein [Bryobacterales bacterium]
MSLAVRNLACSRGWMGLGLLLGLVVGAMHPQAAMAQAVRSGFDTNRVLDDGEVCLDCSAGPIPLGFTVGFAGGTYSTIYVNSHGNVSFVEPLPNNWVPNQQLFDGLNVPIIAPFFADNDATANDTAVTYGTGFVDGRRAFGATYRNQGYYPGYTNRLNTFQVILIERPDRALGDFDIEFNYGQIQWEASGDNASQTLSQGGLNGVCAGRSNCTPAAAGFSYGPSAPAGARSFLLAGSFTAGAFLDGNPTGLVTRRAGSSTVNGRLVFEVRGGTVPLSGTCNTPTGTVGISYQGALEASGGRSPYTWLTNLVSGSLPPGVTFSSNGVLGGGPTTVGTYPFTARVTDAQQQQLNVSCSITVTACNVGVSPSTVSVGSGGGDTTFQVTSTQPCPWTATTNNTWLKLMSSGVPVNSRTGNGQTTVTIRLEANTGAARSGTITVNGATLTVNQASGNGTAPAVPVLNPSSAIFSPTGGTGTFQVSAPGTYTATETLDWVTITSGAGGTGNGTVGYTVSAYTNATRARTGEILVNGVAFKITQNPPNTNCTYSLSATSASFSASGGDGSTKVTTGDGCGWTVSSNDSWLTVDSGSAGTTFGLVNYKAARNTGGARTGTLLIAGITYTVTQAAGTDCATTFLPATSLFLASGSTAAQVRVNTPCTWTATSDAGWLRITSPAGGDGPGVLTFAVDPNASGQTRVGRITARGVQYTVTQLAQSCTYTLSKKEVTLPAGGGSTTMTVNTTTGCVWPAFSAPGFGTVSPSSGAGTGLVTVSAPANSGGERSTTATLAGQTFTIRQAAASGISCVAAAPATIPSVRYSLEAEMTGTPTFTCTGSPGSTGITADVRMTLNTRVTSKIIGENVEALLLIGDPATPVLGTNAFQGKLAGNNAVRFPNVPIGVANSSSSRLFRVVNVRADANAPAAVGNDITATIEILSPLRPVGITNSQNIVIARRAAPVNITQGTPTGQGTITLPVTYTELLTNTFKPKLLAGQNPSTLPLVFTSESGYMNSGTLGPQIGFADNGFRLQMTLRQVPAGMRVLVDPVVTSGAVRAELIAQDPRGLGTGVQSGADREVTIVNGEATITYEITAANPSVLESLTFNVRFQNTTVSEVTTIRGASGVGCGPVATGLPVNGPLPVPRCGTSVLPSRQVVFGGSVQTLGGTANALLRAPGGNISTVLNAEITCETAGGCPDSIVRGNVQAGTNLTGCTAQEGATCEINGSEVTIEVPALDQGERVVTPIAAELLADDPSSIFVRFRGSSCTGLDCNFGEVEQCFTNFSALPNPPIAGVTSGSFQIYPCGAWSITSSVPWVRFQISGSAAAFASTVSGNNPGATVTINYVVDNNTGGNFRTGTVTIGGFPTPITLSQQGGGGGGGTGGLRFVPITPCRLLETRPVYAGTTWTGQNGPPALVAGVERTLQVTNSRCDIPASAKAFVLNVTTDTVYANTGPVDFLTIWPADEGRPNFWTLRTTTGGYVANSAIVKASAAGAIKLYSSNNVNVTLDISGYFTSEPVGLYFYPTASCRPIDTRSIPAYTAGLPPPFGNSRMVAQETRTFRLPASTRCIIPQAQAYSMQFTLTPGVEASGNPVAYLSAWNTGGGEPPVSNLNSLSGYVMSNAAIVPARSDGSINVKTYNETNFLADVNGFFGPDDGTGRGLLYYPVSQCRVMNTQDGTLPGNYGPPAMSPAADREISLPGSTRCPGLPATAKAWALNVTAVPNGTPLAFLSLWQAGTPWPAVSNLNAFEGQTVSNAAIVPGSATGGVLVKVNNPTHVALEVAGYFAR